MIHHATAHNLPMPVQSFVGGVRLGGSFQGQQFPQYASAQTFQGQPSPQPQAQPVQQLQQLQQLQKPAAPAANSTGVAAGAPAAVPATAPPITPKVQTTSPATFDATAAGTRLLASGALPQGTIQGGATQMPVRAFTGQPILPGQMMPAAGGATSREQALEQRVRELEQLLSSKDEQIKDLQASLALAKPGAKAISNGVGGNIGMVPKARSPNRTACSGSKPLVKYTAQDQDDPVDVRLEEFYNSTGSAVQFRRINRGFYRFGDTIAELDIINHKLMARTEDGWNHGKMGPIEKFLMYYENIEREKAGIVPEA